MFITLVYDDTYVSNPPISPVTEKYSTYGCMLHTLGSINE